MIMKKKHSIIESVHINFKCIIIFKFNMTHSQMSLIILNNYLLYKAFLYFLY